MKYVFQLTYKTIVFVGAVAIFALSAIIVGISLGVGLAVLDGDITSYKSVTSYEVGSNHASKPL